MSDVPPPPIQPQYAAYPRGQMALYGSPDKLRALADGYFGLNTVFVLNIVLAIGINVAARSATTQDNWMVITLGGIVLMGLLVGFLTFPHNKKIAYGANWSPLGPVLASVLMALNSMLCCGIIGYVVVQQLAANEMKKYGIKVSFLGFTKKKIYEQAALLEQEQARVGQLPPYG